MRQSTLAQVERNKESTTRQYDLVARARQLGWPASAIRVIDGDLGVSGSVLGHRWIRARRVRDPARERRPRAGNTAGAPDATTSHRQVRRQPHGRPGWRLMPQA